MRTATFALLLFSLCASNRSEAWSGCPDQLDGATRQAVISDIENSLDKFEKDMSLPCKQVSENLKTDPAWYDAVAVAAYAEILQVITKNKVKAGSATIAGAAFHAFVSKPMLNAIFGSCDQQQRKQAVNDANKVRKNLKSEKLSDQQLLTACKNASLFHSPLNLITWKGVRDLISNKSLIPNGLKYFGGGCNHVDKNRNMECISAVAAHCVKEGYVGGFSQNVPLDSIIELCISNLAGELINVKFDVLRDQISSCRELSNLNTPDCAAAAYLFCKDRGLLGGVIQTVDLLTDYHQIGIMCIRDGRMFDPVTPTELASAASPPRCISPTDSSNLFCVSTAHQYCTKRQYKGGIMQNTGGSPNFKILCVQGTEIKAPIE